MDYNLKNKTFKQDAVQQSLQLIQQAQSITFLTHYKPDADGISACAALSAIAEKLGKKVETIYPTAPEFPVKRQSSHVLINKHNQIPDLIIMCDTANYDRLYYPDIFKTIPSINIDHHISNSINGTVNLIATQVSSTCEQVYILLQAWAFAIDTYIAECLLFGMLYDSQVFHTQNTYPDTLRIAADLVEHGAHLFELQSELLYNKNPHILALWGKILSAITIAPRGNAAWCSISYHELRTLGIELSSLVGFSNFLAQLSGVDVTIFFCEVEPGHTKVSLRSKVTDVNQLAGKFGGGGHKNASGVTSTIPMSQLIQEMTKLLM